MEIQVINEIQRILAAAKQDIIELPMIISLGDQSSGKSSVIERIMGRDILPKGSGIVTKRPLILQMSKTDNQNESFKFAHSEKIFTSSKDVMNEIVEETERVCSKSPSGISSIPINLTFYSPKVIDLTLVDLPGLTRVATVGQDESIVESIYEMVKAFVDKENSLILAVIPANNDIANSGALNMIKKVDPMGKRSIACITKIDLMDKGTDCLKVLKNESYYLERGYIGLVNRNQQQIKSNLSYEESLRLEKEFFRNHPIYSEIADKSGTLYLRNFLSEQLVKHIKSCSKKLSSQLYSKLRESTAKVYEAQNNLHQLNAQSGIAYYLKQISDLLIPLTHIYNPENISQISELDKYSTNILQCHQIILKDYHGEAMRITSPSTSIIEAKNNELSFSMFDSSFLIAGAIAHQLIANISGIHDKYISQYINAYGQGFYEYIELIDNQIFRRLLREKVQEKLIEIGNKAREICNRILKTFQNGFLPNVSSTNRNIAVSLPKPISVETSMPAVLECQVSFKKDKSDFKKMKLSIKYRSITIEKDEFMPQSYYAFTLSNKISNKGVETFLLHLFNYANLEKQLLAISCDSIGERNDIRDQLINYGFLDRSNNVTHIIREYEQSQEYLNLIRVKGVENALKHLRLYIEVYMIIDEQIKAIIFCIGKILGLKVMKEMHTYITGYIYSDLSDELRNIEEFNKIKDSLKKKVDDSIEIENMYKKIIVKIKEIV